MYYIGVDVGASHVGAALLLIKNSGHTIQARAHKALEERRAEYVLDVIVRTVLKLGQGLEVAGVGVGAPGWVCNGRIKAAANFPSWGDEPLEEQLRARLALPVLLLNDADAAIAAELWKDEEDAGIRSAALLSECLVCVSCCTGKRQAKDEC
jgi:glucokinase